MLIWKDDNETITIQTGLGEEKLNINTYGPQEGDTNHEILSFWQEIEYNDCLTTLEMDANAKVGEHVINGDPNPMSNNWRFMMDIFLLSNCELMWSLYWTNNKRRSNGKQERTISNSIYHSVCKNEKVFLYDKRITTTKTKTKLITSDHNVLFCKFSVTIVRKQSKIIQELFKFICKQSSKNFL